MKIIVLENNYENAEIEDLLSWYLISDSALTNWGKPFFYPLEMSKVSVQASIAIRISRLGKSVSSRFAPRYYHEVAPMLHFFFPQLKEKLVNRGLSFSRAVSFDKSLIYGEFKEMPDDMENLKLDLTVNRQLAVNFDISKLRYGIDELIPKVSEMNTLKMGDLILPALSEPVEIFIGDLIELKGGFVNPLSVKIK